MVPMKLLYKSGSLSPTSVAVANTNTIFSSFFDKIKMLPVILKIRRLANMKKGRAVQYFATFALSLATVTMGASSAWPAPVIPKLINEEPGFYVADDEISTMLGMSGPGFILGSFVAGFMSDTFGRKMTVLASAAPFAGGTLLAVTAHHSLMLYFMKFLWGFGSGLIASVLNVYLAEVSDKEIRATLSICTRFMFNFGSLLVITLGTLISYSTLNYSLLVLPFIFFVTCLGIPESPYYYMKEGEVDLAKRSLMKLKGGENIKEELEMLQKTVKKEMKNSKLPSLDLFTTLTYWRPIVIASGLKVTQLLSGVVTIQQYLGLITRDVVKDMDPSTHLMIFGVVKVVVCLISSVFADRIGRRPILIWSFMGTAVCLELGSTYFFLQEFGYLEETELHKFRYVPFLSILFSNVISTMGYHAVIGIILAEIFPLNVRAMAISSLNIFGTILSLIVPKLYLVIKNYVGLNGVFSLFSSAAFIGAMLSASMVPETKGKTLNEIQEILKFRKDHVPNANNGMSAVKVDETQELVEPKKKDVK